MKKYQFGICGPFDFEEKGTGGQSVKTREFYYALKDVIGGNKIAILESTSYKKNPVSFFIKMIRLMKVCDNVIIFPANKGIKVFAPLCALIAPRYKTKTHYNVIGGWLPKLVADNPGLKKHLIKFTSILVETSTMKAELEKQGFRNIYKLANFKRLEPVTEVKDVSNPVRLCYFSRVTELKGIEDAVRVVNHINKEKSISIFDIYGPVVPDYEESFKKLQESFGRDVSYKGKIAPADSIRTLKNYDLQLFPTLYATEGIPGSILDSYFAGTPVVSARWNSFDDVVKEGITGIGFEQGNPDDLYKHLSSLLENPSEIMRMKKNCLKEADQYRPVTVIRQFLDIVKDHS